MSYEELVDFFWNKIKAVNPEGKSEEEYRAECMAIVHEPDNNTKSEEPTFIKMILLDKTTGKKFPKIFDGNGEDGNLKDAKNFINRVVHGNKISIIDIEASTKFQKEKLGIL